MSTDLRLEVVSGPAAGFAFSVDDRLVFGRQSEGFGRLGDDPELSRHHAEITIGADGTYSIEDLASTNGTLVNGQRIAVATVLSTRDTIEVGGTTLSVAFAPAAPPPATTPQAPPTMSDVDARAATVTVDTPPGMQSGSAPAPPAPEPVAPPAPEPVAPPPPEPVAPPPPAPEPVAPAPPAPEPVAPPAPEPVAPAPPAPEPVAPPAPEPVAPAPPAPEPAPITVEAPAPLPRLNLQLMVDPEAGVAEIRLDDSSAPIRLTYRDGSWQATDGGT